MIAKETISNGLENVTVAETKLSLVDGVNGRLIINGTALEKLSKLEYEDVYRTILPHGAPLGPLRLEIFQKLRPVLSILPGLDPMQALRLALASLPDQTSEEELVAAFPVLLAACRNGTELAPPDPSLTVAQDLVRLFFQASREERLCQAVNAYLVTVCEHGMNASTFASRVVASTGARPVSTALAGLSALSGPLHGGAPGPVLDMLDELRGVSDKVGHLKAKLANGERLMGFGHRVYRTRDPRAAVLKRAVSSLGSSSYLHHAEEVEKAALEALADHKPGRSLQTNVEFYTSVLLQEVGFQREWFTPLFATGRILGWMAHYREQRAGGRLIRPKATYVGPMPGGSSEAV
jgi:citrate synthase